MAPNSITSPVGLILFLRATLVLDGLSVLYIFHLHMLRLALQGFVLVNEVHVLTIKVDVFPSSCSMEFFFVGRHRHFLLFLDNLYDRNSLLLKLSIFFSKDFVMV